MTDVGTDMEKLTKIYHMLEWLGSRSLNAGCLMESENAVVNKMIKPVAGGCE